MDLKEEMYQDMLEEARREEYMEVKLRTDYDSFCDYFLDDMEALRELIATVKAQHESYDWEFDIKYFE